MSVTLDPGTDFTMPRVQKPVPPPTSTTCMYVCICVWNVNDGGSSSGNGEERVMRRSARRQNKGKLLGE